MKADMKKIIAKSQIAAMLNLLEDYVIPIINDIGDVLPDAYWNGYADAFDAALSYAQAFVDTFKH